MTGAALVLWSELPRKTVEKTRANGMRGTPYR